MDRIVRNKKTIKDLKKPLTKTEKSRLISSDDCFGLEYDLRTKECRLCADNELCCLLFKGKLDEKVNNYEVNNEATLDKADLSLINKEEIYGLCKRRSGELSTKELVGILMDISHLTDEISIIEYLKRFKVEYNISIKGGIVYV